MVNDLYSVVKKGKYYVGHTDRKDGERFNEHFSGKGAKWTKKYEPLIVLEQREGTLEDEDRVTLEMMEKHSWTNVRGGKWCKVKMTHPPQELLDRILIKNKISQCSRCGRSNHDISRCVAKTHLSGHKLKPIKLSHDLIPNNPSNTESPYASTNVRESISNNTQLYDPISYNAPNTKSSYDPISHNALNIKSSYDPISYNTKYQQMMLKQYDSNNEINNYFRDREELRRLSINNGMNMRIAANINDNSLYFIKFVMNMNSTEKIEICYLDDVYKYNNIDHNSSFTVITNLRLLRHESGLITAVNIFDIRSLRHENNWIYPDRLICNMKSGAVVSFDIYDYQSCNYFGRYIDQKVHNINPITIQDDINLFPLTEEFIKLPRNTSSNVKLADDMSRSDIITISNFLQFDKDETLKVMYLMVPFNYGRIIKDDTFVCITNKRLIKCEDRKIDSTLLDDISYVQHEKNIICWDNIICHLVNSHIKKVGIYDANSCDYFCKYLNL